MSFESSDLLENSASARGTRVVLRPVSRSARTKHRLKNPQRGPAGFVRRRVSEQGYVLVTTVIILPLMVIALAAATDATYYYSRVIELQRAADTAALAGVVRMPRTVDASRVALETAKRNGFEHNHEGVTVTAEPPADTNRRLAVTVKDDNIELVFASFFRGPFSATRKATAEYISNIPLGSVLNAIGTGNLRSGGLDNPQGEGLAPIPQNFWLSLAGPCAPKEAGDQVSSRYDGTSVNVSDGTFSNAKALKYKRLCDFDVANPGATRAEQIATIQNAHQTASPNGLFAGASLNRDFNPLGYNYIVDVPCTPIDGVIRPAPCPADDLTTVPLYIDVFDPFFAPDSLRRFGTGAPAIRPDNYGVFAKRVSASCSQSLPSECLVAEDPSQAWSPGEIPPHTVDMATEFRVYNADQTPNDFEDDTAVTVPTADFPNAVTTGPEAGLMQRYGACIYATDKWMSTAGLEYKDEDGNFKPDTVVGGEEYVLAPGTTADEECAEGNITSWRRLAVVPANSPRGRYRINVRSVSARNSFGTNAFSLRASFASPFASCDSSDPLQAAGCPSVSGDSSMSVFASVPNVSDFYLAKLSPASLFRDRTVVLNLWDPGEGGSTIEVLRPNASLTCADAAMTVLNPLATGFCKQRFSYSLQHHGVNKINANAFNPNGEAMADRCAGDTATNLAELSVAGNWNFGTCTALDAAFVENRTGYQDRVYSAAEADIVTDPSGICSKPTLTSVACRAGKFNGRMVAIQIQIESNYGCADGTGLKTADSPPCQEVTNLPNGGWWKIRYRPLTKTWGSPGYVPITDQTTWSVRIMGDPVHLVRSD
jgi:hypothetical protein